MSEKDQFRAIMLVDDNEIDNIINQKMIESCGKSKVVFSHTSAKSALEYLRSIDRVPSDVSDFLPELIFLDINMPIMDGFQFLEEFEKLSKKVKDNCKIVLLTSSLNPRDLTEAKKNSHVYKYLNKPLTESNIMEL